MKEKVIIQAQYKFNNLWINEKHELKSKKFLSEMECTLIFEPADKKDSTVHATLVSVEYEVKELESEILEKLLKLVEGEKKVAKEKNLEKFINIHSGNVKFVAERAVNLLKWVSSAIKMEGPLNCLKLGFKISDNDFCSFPSEPKLYLGSYSPISMKTYGPIMEFTSTKEMYPPQAHELYREACTLAFENNISSLVIGVAAIETGVKHFVSEMMPDAEWFLENTTATPIGLILRKLYPSMPTKGKAEGNNLAIEKGLIKTIEDAASLRNKIVHRPNSGKVDLDYLLKFLEAVKRILLVLDFSRGNQWALYHFNEKERKFLVKDNDVEFRTNPTRPGF